MKKIVLLFLPFLCFAKNLALENRFNPPARELMDVEIIGDIMIIPGNLDGYDFYDISNPTDPTLITNFEVPMGNRSLPGLWVSAADSVAYFTCRTRQDGSAIVNFSDPSNPEHIGSLSVSGTNINNPSFEGSDIYGDMLAVAAHEDGVLFYDISDPINPELNYSRSCENAWTVAFVDSNHIAIGNGEFGVILEEISCIIDSCDGSSFLTQGSVKDLEVQDSLLFIAEGSHGISVYEISNINEPVLLDQFDTQGLANKIAVFDSNKIAVSDWLDVKILEWTGETLELVGYKRTGKRTMSIGARDSVIYSAEWQHLQIFSFGEIEEADLDISSWDISFPSLETGESDTFDLLVENNGQFPLGFSPPFLNHNDFQTINFPEYIEPGDTALAQIVYTKSNQNASGMMRITSNDPDESEIEVLIIGNYEGGIVGLDAPDFTLPIVANSSGDFTLSDHLGQIVVVAFFAPG